MLSVFAADAAIYHIHGTTEVLCCGLAALNRRAAAKRIRVANMEVSN